MEADTGVCRRRPIARETGRDHRRRTSTRSAPLHLVQQTFVLTRKENGGGVPGGLWMTRSAAFAGITGESLEVRHPVRVTRLARRSSGKTPNDAHRRPESAAPDPGKMLGKPGEMVDVNAYAGGTYMTLPVSSTPVRPSDPVSDAVVVFHGP